MDWETALAGLTGLFGGGFLSVVIGKIWGRLDGSTRQRDLAARIETYCAVKDDPKLGPVMLREVEELLPKERPGAHPSAKDLQQIFDKSYRRARLYYIAYTIVVIAMVALSYLSDSAIGRSFVSGVAVLYGIMMLVQARREHKTECLLIQAVTHGLNNKEQLLKATRTLNALASFVVDGGHEAEFDKFMAAQKPAQESAAESEDGRQTDAGAEAGRVPEAPSVPNKVLLDGADIRGGNGAVGSGGAAKVKGGAGQGIHMIGGSIVGGDGGDGGGKGGDASLEGGNG